MEFEIHTLSNGIRVIHKQIKTCEVSHCAIIVNAGSRDEELKEHGVAHFIEHSIFKGTGKRKAYHILNRLDAVGGELNAYTTKEITCIHASFLNEYYGRAVELLADITFNCTFPEKEILKEKEVIIDEINSYLDSPSEQIFDDFEAQVFGNHPIGRDILGTVSSLKKLKRNNLFDFMDKHYVVSNLVFSSVSNLSMNKVIQLAEKHLGSYKNNKSERPRLPIYEYIPSQVTIKKSHHQSHAIIGNLAYSRMHEKKTGLILLNNILGGPAMNSRLNLSIREKYGFTYNLESNYSAYSDTGVFSLYLGTDNKYLDKTIGLVKEELKKLRDNKLGINQLQSAKKQIIGQLALSEESKSGTMLALGKSLLLLNKVETLPEIYAKIDAITADSLLEIANEIFDEKQLSSLILLGK